MIRLGISQLAQVPCDIKTLNNIQITNKQASKR